MSEELYSFEKIGELLNITARAVRNRSLNMGVIPCQKISGKYFFNKEQVELIIEHKPRVKIIKGVFYELEIIKVTQNWLLVESKINNPNFVV